MESHIDEVVKRLEQIGLEPRLVENAKHHYRVKKRNEPYLYSEVNKKDRNGNHYGAYVFFERGVLLIEYNATQNVYNAEFRLTTSDRKSLPMSCVSPALEGITSKRQYWIYRPSLIGVQTIGELIKRIDELKLLKLTRVST